MTYRLSRHARDDYDQKIETVDANGDPIVLAWQGSFDDGATWHDAIALTGEDAGWIRWLIAGDLAGQGDAVAVLAPTGDRDLQPLARAVLGPRILVVSDQLEPIRVE